MKICLRQKLWHLCLEKITSLLVVSDKYKDKKNKILKGIIHIHFLLNDETR